MSESAIYGRPLAPSGQLYARPSPSSVVRFRALAAASGSVGALAAGLPGIARDLWAGAPGDQRWFLATVPVARTSPRSSGRACRKTYPGKNGRCDSNHRPLDRHDWRRVVGLFADSEFMKQVDAEGQAIRDTERAEAAATEPAV